MKIIRVLMSVVIYALCYGLSDAFGREMLRSVVCHIASPLICE